VGDYPIVRALKPDQSYLALDSAGRQVVIKILDSDCLLRGRLHPNIQSRLARVRELAHTAVANLHGVERAGGKAFVVWQYIPGTTLDQYAPRLESPATLAQLAREIVLAVESLHLLGIVHGRIHANNVIIDELGKVHLTHVSPLLYDDPATDGRDLAAMIATLANQHGWGDSSIARLAAQSLSLPQLRNRLSPSPESQPTESMDDPHLSNGPRRAAWAAAGVTTLLALLLAAGLFYLTHRALPPASAPRQAAPAAMHQEP
jgi:serine/threonine protein kinase